MADPQSTHRDVEQELLEKGVKRPRERLDGEPIYCFDYSKDMMDFDNWDYLVQTKYCCRNGLTISRFDKPPKFVLDVGCGAGLWTIEAAKQWKESEIVGVDFLENYPKKGLPDALAKRITWIQGNFLEPLQLPSNHFDLVRLARLGFHVPENEGPKILEEVYRVMKPGAVVEMIEEDIIFPHARLSRAPDIQPRTAPMETIPEQAVYSPQNRQDLTASQSSLGDLSAETPMALPRSPTSSFSSGSSRTVPYPIEIPKFEFDTSSSAPLRLSESKPQVDPRDHSQLNEAWEAMLDKYFLTSRLTSVLQHYLPVAFSDVQSHATMQVILPPNSEQYQKNLGRQAPSLKASEVPDSSLYFDHDDDSAIPTRDDRSSIKSQRPKQSTSWASMHLARTVCAVMGCKEKIWAAYLELFSKQHASPRVVRSPADAAKPAASGKDNSNHSFMRDAFESAWANWESDMKDRIGTRGMISGRLEWAEPEGDIPDWRAWRDSLKTPVKEQDHDGDTDNKDFCRIIRAFVGRKPLSDQRNEGEASEV